ncbi:uncharacterized protein LOC123928425 isoform X8 [Meles meles]|uniref:uncharacterized protein LOC123928425 isoform X8 n=2 Tax=Meles meles TaxID=9662 RepID=UPI001E69FD23|nr:uncharacterized protein LOC123928425 isoform X8 [Meles meles]
MPMALPSSLPRGLFLVSPAGTTTWQMPSSFRFSCPPTSHQKFSLCAVISPFTWLGNQRLWQLGEGGALSAWPRVLAAGQSPACYKGERTPSPACPLHPRPTQFRETWWGRLSGTMLTELESAMNSLIDVYHKYSLEKGNYHALYRDDLKKLLETECPRYLKKKDADTWFKELDINSDGAINFEEFLILVIKVGVASHEDIHRE